MDLSAVAKRIRFFLPIHFILFFLVANTYFALSNVPLVAKISRTPKDTVFPLYHSAYPYDYNVYLSVITLGNNGYWLNRDAFTSENTKPGIFYFYYILVGKVTGLFHIWQPVAYHIARILNVELYLIFSYFLISKFIAKPFFSVALLFSLFGSIPPPFIYNEPGALTSYIPWWMGLEALNRLDSLPHHILGQALLLLSVILIFQYIKTRRPIFIILSCISLLIQGIVLPPSILPVLLGLPLAGVLWIIRKLAGHTSVKSIIKMFCPDIRAHKIPRFLLGLGLILIAAGIPLLISKWQTQQGYPWPIWITWEIAKWNKEPNFARDFCLSFGLLSLIALPAAIRSIMKGRFKDYFITVWAILPLIILPFADILQIGKIRVITCTPIIPLSILAAKTIKDANRSKLLQTAMIVLILITSVPVSLDLLYKNIVSIRKEAFYTNIYIPTRVWSTVKFIQNTLPKDAVILSNESVGNIIPAYAPVISYLGHVNQTLDYPGKTDNAWLFYNRKWSEEKAYDFIRSNRISYVYYGPDERYGESGDLPYLFLKPLFQSGDVTLYRVQK